MTIIQRKAEVNYSPQQMYVLVDDIESYPKFLPWCVESTVISRDDDQVQASLLVSAAGIRKEFTTHNRMQKNKMIEIRLVNGPFKHLEGFWRFDKIHHNQSSVSLDLEFEMAGRLLDYTFGPVFHSVANTLVDAFVKRAAVVYGENGWHEDLDE